MLRGILSGMRSFASGIVLCLAACVPATAEVQPRGAVAMRLEPSPASRGEPFTTTDGWSVTLETFVLLVSANARPEDMTLGVFGGGDVLLDGRRREDIVVVGVPAGRAYGLITFNWSARSSDGSTMLADDVRGVPPEIVERFLRPPSGRGMPPSADGSVERDPTFVIGPSVIVTVRARKGDRTITLDVALRASIEHHATPVAVVADALTPATVPLVVEALFTRAGALVFEDIAAADINGDGVIDSEELGPSGGTCTVGDPWSSDVDEEECGEPSLVDTLEGRVPDVIGLPLESLDDGEPVFDRSARLASGRQTRHAAPP